MNLSLAITKGTVLAPFAARAYFQFPGPNTTDALLGTGKPGSCPLGAAYLGSLRDTEVAGFWTYIKAISNESLCEFMHKNLMRTFPQLGQTVRTWPRLAAELEREFAPALLSNYSLPPRKYPNKRPDAGAYRRQVHCSLWRAITTLHDEGRSKERIATALAGAGL